MPGQDRHRVRPQERAIGLIGFMLDRLMFALQRAFTFSANR
jgi:hypothetical protein